MNVGFATERLDAEPLSLAAHEAEPAALHADERVLRTMGGSTATADESRAWIERNLRHGKEPASRRVMEKVGFRFERDVEHHGRPRVLYRRTATS